MTNHNEERHSDEKRMAAEATEAHRHACEVRSVVAMYHAKGGAAVKSFLLQVEKHRGSESAARLRQDALTLLEQGK